MITMQHARLEEQTAIIEMISSRKPLGDVLSVILSNLENTFKLNEVKCSIMLYENETNTLTHTFTNTLSTDFVNAIDPVDVSPYGGSSGTAAYFKKPVIVEDIEANPICTKYRHIAFQYGIRSSWACPIMTKTGVLLGTLEFYSAMIGRPTDEQLVEMEAYSRLAALAITNDKMNN